MLLFLVLVYQRNCVVVLWADNYRRNMYALMITYIYTFDSIEREVEKFEEDIK
jgi:hypothetical protein